MSGVSLVQEIVSILVAGITGLGQGIGQGVSNFVTSLAYVTVGTGSDATTEMSPLFVIIIVFAAIGLAIGLTRLVWMLLTSLGAQH